MCLLLSLWQDKDYIHEIKHNELFKHATSGDMLILNSISSFVFDMVLHIIQMKVSKNCFNKGLKTKQSKVCCGLQIKQQGREKWNRGVDLYGKTWERGKQW